MRFEKPKGQRLHKQFYGIRVRDMWWVPAISRWVKDYRTVEDYDMASTYRKCKSLKAFRRHLRKNPEIIGKAILVSNFVGYNVFG